MTHGKTREAAMRATEDVVFGYRPSSVSSRMNNDDEPDDDELLTDSEPTYAEACVVKITVGELKKAIREALERSDLTA